MNRWIYSFQLAISQSAIFNHWLLSSQKCATPSFKSINSETQAEVSHELRTDTFDFRLNNFFRRGNEKLDALDRKLAELRPAPTGEPSLTTQAVGHLTAAGGLVLSGAILAQSIRQLEEGNTSPEAAVGTALGLGVELEIAPQSSRSEPAHPGAPAR